MGSTWHVYCDESCIKKPNRYAGVGGIMARVDAAAEVRDRILEWRDWHDMWAELKWQKVSARHLMDYEHFVAQRFNDMTAKRIAFCCLFVEASTFNHRAHGCEDLSYSRLYYQIILHRFIRLMELGDRLLVFPDKKNTKIDYSALVSSLNASIRQRYRRQRNVVIKAEEVDSKSTHLGQANDLLLGAVGFQVNRRHERKEGSAAKKSLAEYIAELAKLPNLADATPVSRTDFGIWRFNYYSVRTKSKGAAIT